jgi:drug/metabolite transporter (DMT)-like permease
VYARRTTEDAPAVMRSVGPLISSTVVMWLAAPVLEAPFKIPQLPITWIALLWLGVLGSGFAFILSYYLIHEIGPTRTSMVTYIFPLGGVILGVLFLGEQLTWQVAAGALLIIAGMAFVNLRPGNAAIEQASE